jgi:hypothetical protein
MQATYNSSEYNLNTIKHRSCIVQWVLKPPCVWGLMQNRDSLCWQWSAQSRHSRWSQLASHVISSWLVTTIHERLESQMIRFTNSETLLCPNDMVHKQRDSTVPKWKGSQTARLYCAQMKRFTNRETPLCPNDKVHKKRDSTVPKW